MLIKREDRMQEQQINYSTGADEQESEVYGVVTDMDILSCECIDVDPSEIPTQEFKELILKMIKTMIYNRGVGLAANQVGELKKLFVTTLPELPVAINPTITKTRLQGQTTKKEGCLSFPGKIQRVRRPWSIRLRYQNTDGEWHERDFVGWSARVIQHEMGHLNGETII